jgi:hypothetical protein
MRERLVRFDDGSMRVLTSPLAQDSIKLAPSTTTDSHYCIALDAQTVGARTDLSEKSMI